jgi:hypothetical protein
MSMAQAVTSTQKRVRVKKTSVSEKLAKDHEESLKVVEKYMDKGDTELEWYFNELNLYYQYMYQQEGVAKLYLKPALEQMDVLKKKEMDESSDASKKESVKKKMAEQVELVNRLKYMIRDAKRETAELWKIYIEKAGKTGKSKAKQLEELKHYYADKETKIQEVKMMVEKQKSSRK